MGRRHRRRRHRRRNQEQKMKQKIGFKPKKRFPSLVVVLCTGCLFRHIGHNNVTCAHTKR